MFDYTAFENPDRRYGPFQVVHDFQFVALNLKEIYNWLPETTEEEKLAHIKWRLERLAARGYAGVVLNCDHREYMQERALVRLRSTLEYVRELGLKAWIYDEQYYPTGSAGGLTLRDHPELNNQALACVAKDVGDTRGGPVRIHSPHGHSELKFAFAAPCGDTPDFSKIVDISDWRDPSGGLCWDKPDGRWRVWCFFVRVLYELTYKPTAGRAPRRCPSVLDRRAMGRFLNVTWGPYEKYLGEYLGSTVVAVFTDEPSVFAPAKYPDNLDPDAFRTRFPSVSVYDRPDLDVPLYPYIPWTDDFAEVFEARCGYSLIPRLPELFSGKICDTRALRRDWCETQNALFDNAYLTQFNDRLGKNGIGYSGHYISEENFEIQPSILGDYLNAMGKQAIPGCDLLLSHPGSLSRSTALRLASSAAHIYGKPHVMIEASNMCDKDQTFSVERIKHAMALMSVNGVDTITSYYGEELFDEDGYRDYTRYLARLGTASDGGVRRVDALIWYPYEYICGYIKPFASSLLPDAPDPESDLPKKAATSAVAIMNALLDCQTDNVFINTDALRKAVLADGAVRLPSGDSPRALILPDLARLDRDLAELFERAAAAGVKLYAPHEIEGLDVPLHLLADGLPERSGFIAESPEPRLNVLLRSFAGYDLYLAVNASPDEGLTVGATVPAATLSVSDITSGGFAPLPSEAAGGRTRFTLSLAPKEAKLIIAE